MASISEFWLDLVKPALNNVTHDMVHNMSMEHARDGHETFAKSVVSDQDGTWTAELAVSFMPSDSYRAKALEALAKRPQTRDWSPDGEPA